MDSQAFLVELVWFAPLLGKRNNLESILLISPMAKLSRLVALRVCGIFKANRG
jgi:hypothetical protein